ncbi:MAG: AAA family ATPase [Bacteroidales bacterium]|nr:AAA family ATPase [Bacteroidales bacterium]
MMSLPTRFYTAGIQDFADIRERNLIYVDKTDLIYRLTHESKFVFLSRPRRFGKTLLCTTLKCYFEGRKELFEGLAMEKLETEWTKYPVLHFDLSFCKNQYDIQGIIDELNIQISRYEKLYGRNEAETTPGKRFAGIMERACEQTELKCAVILDEYDAPLLDSLNDSQKLAEIRRVMQEFYQPLKACERYEHFVFITGITKFSQLSIFSTINNITNISMLPQYSAICGITVNEALDVFKPDIQELANAYSCSYDEMVDKLKAKYDGYNFSRKSPDIFNPFSLTMALKNRELDSYWFGSGTPTYLFEQMKRFGTNILSLEKITASASDFDVPTENMHTALPLLYQSGYLTIKRYDMRLDRYELDFPNAEVRVGFMENLLPHITGDNIALARNTVTDLYDSLYRNDIESAMQYLKAYFASIPYLEHGRSELGNLTTFEAFYETIMYVIFSMVSKYVYTQVKSANGRSDIVMFVDDTAYVFELKINGTAREALDQINSNGYMVPYEAGNRKVVKVGVAFSKDEKNITDWIVEQKNN